jgi:hypothetical protein
VASTRLLALKKLCFMNFIAPMKKIIIALQAGGPQITGELI